MLYVIECRNAAGQLDLSGAQPESVFGLPAIQGISEDDMAKRIFAHKPDAVLDGRFVSNWPCLIDSRWVARRKYW